MKEVLGIPLSTWDTELQILLTERGVMDDLIESDEDSYLPYFATRTLSDGVHRGSLADLALLIEFGADDITGYRFTKYCMKAFTLATGLEPAWFTMEMDDAMTALREIAD